jgi:hypothetical protein
MSRGLGKVQREILDYLGKTQPAPEDGWPDDHAGWVTLTDLGFWAGVESADYLDPSPYQLGGFPWDEVVQLGDRAFYVPLDSALSREPLRLKRSRREAVRRAVASLARLGLVEEGEWRQDGSRTQTCTRLAERGRPG